MKFKRLARLARLFQEGKVVEKKEPIDNAAEFDHENLSVVTESGGSISITLKDKQQQQQQQEQADVAAAVSNRSYLSKISEAGTTDQDLVAVVDTDKGKENSAEKDDHLGNNNREDIKALQIRDGAQGGIEINTNWLPTGSNKEIQEKQAAESELTTVKLERVKTNIDVEDTGDIELNMLMEASKEKLIVSSGGIDVIVNAMKAHSHSSAIQEFGCRALENLSNCEGNQDTIVGAGAIDAMLCAMKEHRDSPAIQGSAYGALEKLTLDSDGANAIGSAEGGVQVILDGMKHYLKHNVNIPTRGCAVLVNLSSHPGSLSAMVSADTIATILSTMQEHMNVSEIQESGCLCLLNMLADTKDDCATFDFTGVVTIILTAMKEHLTNANVQKAGTSVLQYLSTDATNANLIASTGGINILLSVMEGHQGISAIQDAGCRTLCNLLRQDPGAEENRNEIVADGGIRVVLNAMKEHGEVVAVQESGCAALMHLSCNASSS